MSRLHRDGEPAGPGEPRRGAGGRGRADLYEVIHDFQTMTLRRQDRRRAQRGIVLGVAEEPGDDAEPALDGEPRQPGRRTTTRAPRPNGADYVRCRTADGTALRGRDLRSLSFQGAATLPPLPLAWTVVDDDPDRPGNSVLWSGNGNNTRRRGGHPRWPCRPPTRRCASTPSTAPSSASTTATSSVSTDGGATYTPIAGDKTIDGPLGPGAERHHRRVRAAQLRPVRVRRPDGAARLPVRQRRRRQRGRPARRRRHRRRHGGQRRLQPGRRSTRRPRSARPPVNNWNVKLIGFDESTSSACSSSSTAGTDLRSAACSWPCSRVPEGRRRGRLRRADRAGPAVRAVHPDGQRRRAAGRRAAELTIAGKGGPPRTTRGGSPLRRSWTYLSDLPDVERDKSKIDARPSGARPFAPARTGLAPGGSPCRVRVHQTRASAGLLAAQLSVSWPFPRR